MVVLVSYVGTGVYQNLYNGLMSTARRPSQRLALVDVVDKRIVGTVL